MNRKKLLLFIFVPVVVILLLFLLNFFVKQRIENRLEQLDSQISYEALEVNIYLNRYRLEELQTRQPPFSLGAKQVIFKGVSYSTLLFDGDLEIDQLEVVEPEIIRYKGEESSGKKSSDRNVSFGEILLKNGSFSSKQSDTAGNNTLFMKFPEVKLKPLDGKLGNLDYESYRIQLDSVYLKINEQHYISVGSAEAENGNVRITDFAIESFFPKNEFDQNIPFEKDRIDLQVPLISLENFGVKKVNDTLQISNSNMTVSEAHLEIYRNKLNPDDPGIKPLYNEMLRKAPVKLNLEQVLVEKGEIIYEELTQKGRPEAVIRFTGVEGEINNLQNISDSLPQPKISAHAHFMRGTQISFNFTFPVFDARNEFHTSGEFGKIEGEALDPFLIPAMDVQARGTIKEISFDFYGNEEILKGTFSMDYERLKVELLKDEGQNERNFLSSLANLFVENKGEAGGQEAKIDVERNKKRSFWNFIWLGLRKGFEEIVEQFQL